LTSKETQLHDKNFHHEIIMSDGKLGNGAFTMRSTLLLFAFVLSRVTSALQVFSSNDKAITRRAVISGVASAIILPPNQLPANADDAAQLDTYRYENRDRNKNKDALIREDYWCFSGRRPPRRLDINALPADDPQWNAWGECTKSETTGNSCVYVSLKQRIPAYGKFFFSIDNGIKEYSQLGKILRSSNPNWNEAAKLVDPGFDTRMPSPAVDSLLKMALFATQMLTSPNFTGPNRELLVSRYYINECAFALNGLAKSIDERDVATSLSLWEFGKDSFNSYLVILNRSISPKVGDKFDLVS
jgi:hypothetical protein